MHSKVPLHKQLIGLFAPKVLEAVARLPDKELAQGAYSMPQFLTAILGDPDVEYRGEKTFSIDLRSEPMINFRIHGDLEFFREEAECHAPYGAWNGPIISVALHQEQGDDTTNPESLVVRHEKSIKDRILYFYEEWKEAREWLEAKAASAARRRLSVERVMSRLEIQKVDPPELDKGPVARGLYLVEPFEP